ncbi:hypothetical protein VNO80_11770 [Phaseolus coccineus]|uniref:Uncharacterized protein n=1 Tax=Phaseolus coccineus TaxID=3886 RepID=A0AAN9NFS7_PHACN
MPGVELQIIEMMSRIRVLHILSGSVCVPTLPNFQTHELSYSIFTPSLLPLNLHSFGPLSLKVKLNLCTEFYKYTTSLPSLLHCNTFPL